MADMSNEVSSLESGAPDSQLALPSICSSDTVRAINATRGGVLAARVALALGPLRRVRGLIGRPPLQPGEAMLLRPCTGVHTWWMRYPIDVLVLDAEGVVVASVPRLRPWRVTKLYRGAMAVLELPAGVIADTCTASGDRVAFGRLG